MHPALEAGLLALVVLLGALMLGQRRAAARLRRRVAAATAELERTQAAFSRFAPGRVVDQVLRDGVAHTAERRVVTVLFADLCGFTKMSAALDPQTVVGILNRYFACTSAAIGDNRGHVSKFIGDGILALFGAIESNPWQAQDAVRAGLAMLTAVEQLSDELEREGLSRLQVAIGIHRGEVIAGVVGSPQLVEYTVLGHHVNLASRIEGLTRRLGVPLLITEAVRREVDGQFVLDAMPPETVKGVDEPVATFAVRGE